MKTALTLCIGIAIGAHGLRFVESPAFYLPVWKVSDTCQRMPLKDGQGRATPVGLKCKAADWLIYESGLRMSDY